MKRKYGAARANETLAEQRMRDAAKEMGDNSFNFGSKLKKGSPTRGKRRGRVYRIVKKLLKWGQSPFRMAGGPA